MISIRHDKSGKLLACPWFDGQGRKVFRFEDRAISPGSKYIRKFILPDLDVWAETGLMLTELRNAAELERKAQTERLCADLAGENGETAQKLAGISGAFGWDGKVYEPNLINAPIWFADGWFHESQNRICRECGEPFYGCDSFQNLCSNECANAGAKRSKLKWWNENKPATRAKEREPKDCRWCGETFTPKRSDAKTCSPKCRVAAHRAKPV